MMMRLLVIVSFFLLDACGAVHRRFSLRARRSRGENQVCYGLGQNSPTGLQPGPVDVGLATNDTFWPWKGPMIGLGGRALAVVATCTPWMGLGGRADAGPADIVTSRATLRTDNTMRRFRGMVSLLALLGTKLWHLRGLWSMNSFSVASASARHLEETRPGADALLLTDVEGSPLGCGETSEGYAGSKPSDPRRGSVQLLQDGSGVEPDVFSTD